MRNTRNIKCSFCNSKSTLIFYKNNNWSIAKCKDCGFIYTNPIPKDLAVFYSEDYFKDERHKKKFFNADGSLKVENEDYLNRILVIENHVKERGSVLEIGAARGGFLKQMQDRSWRVSGVEISQDAVNIAKRHFNINLFRGNYIEYPSPKEYDVICMYQTLEHLPNPKEVLIKTFRDLKNKGILVIEVPNIKGWDIKWNKERKRLVYDLPRHLNHFSPQFLKKELQKIGFEILLIDLYYPNFILKILTWIIGAKRNNNIEDSVKDNSQIEQKPLLKINKTWKSKLLDIISILFPGWRFTIVAQKNNE